MKKIKESAILLKKIEDSTSVSTEDVCKIYSTLALEDGYPQESHLTKKIKKLSVGTHILKHIEGVRKYISENAEEIVNKYSSSIKDDSNEDLSFISPEDLLNHLTDELDTLQSTSQNMSDNDWFNISEQDSGGFASYNVIQEFYTKTPHLSTDISFITEKVKQNIILDDKKLKDLTKGSLKHQIITEFLDKIPIMVSNYLLYGVSYIVPERITEYSDKLATESADETNVRDTLDNYKDLSKEKFRLRVLTPLECIPKFVMFDGILSDNNREKYNLYKDWGWQQYDPFDMIYVYRSKKTIVENLIIPVVSLAKSGNIDLKKKLRGGDESLLSRLMDIYVSIRLIEQVLESTIPMTNILTVKDPSQALSSILGTGDYSDETAERITEAMLNASLDGGVPIMVSSPSSETRFDSPVYEHLLMVLKMFIALKNRAISGDPLKIDNLQYDEGNMNFVHWLSSDVIRPLFKKYAKMIKHVYDIELDDPLIFQTDSWILSTHEKKIRAVSRIVDTLNGSFLSNNAISPKGFAQLIGKTVGVSFTDSDLENIVDVPMEVLKENYIQTIKNNAQKNNGDSNEPSHTKGSIPENDNI